MTRRLLIAAALFSAACTTARPPAPVAQPRPSAMLGEHGFDLTSIDRAVSPCDDFDRYANGGWRNANPLPATYSRYGRFEEVAERNRATLRSILEEAAKQTSAPRGSNAQKLGDFWFSCINEAAIEAAGVEPIRPDLDRIAAIRTRAEVTGEIHRQHRKSIEPVFRFAAQNDIRNSTTIIAVVAQGGLGLPDREYYLRDDDKFRDTRREYVAHLTRMFELAGIPRAKALTDAERVIALETALARASMTRADQRRPENTYHMTAVSELAQIAPLFNFPAFFRELGLGELRALNVAQPEYIREANRLLDELPLESWKAYLRWRILDEAAPYLSSPFVRENFAFRQSHLTGAREIQPRWQRCVRAADQNLGQLLGQEYVRRAFSPEAKAKMNELIDNLVGALRETLPALTWMGPQTKQTALAKLEAFRRRIGYPETWGDFTGLDLGRESYAANVFAARAFQVSRTAGRVGKPDDPNDWGSFTPSTVNASYSPTRNNITFPAGILQPPFYDPHADDAYNYGGIGTAIGHEMTHGFDDQGAKFDPEGNLRNWWTPADLEQFQQRARCIAKQYAEWEVEEGLHLQGELVTGEAIADLGGVTLALRAYQKSLANKPRATVDGFTPEQRFFLGFAQVWGQQMAAEEGRRRALVDPHAPGPARVNLTVSNMPAFATAWNCTAGAKMARAAGERCTVW